MSESNFRVELRRGPILAPRTRGLDDARQERGDHKGKSQRIPGPFQHVPEPGLLGEWRRGVLEKGETEDDHGAPQEGRGHGPESRQSPAHQDRARATEHVERDDPDVECDDHDQGRYADAPAKNQGQRSLGRNQPGAKNAHHDEGHRGHALGDAAGKGPPEQRGEPVAGPPTRGPSQLPARQCLQILRGEPHPHDEQAEPARDLREEFAYACVHIADPPALPVPHGEQPGRFGPGDPQETRARVQVIAIPLPFTMTMHHAALARRNRRGRE